MSYSRRDLPKSYPHIDPKDIHENGLFLTDDQLALAEKKLENLKDGRYGKDYFNPVLHLLTGVEELKDSEMSADAVYLFLDKQTNEIMYATQSPDGRKIIDKIENKLDDYAAAQSILRELQQGKEVSERSQFDIFNFKKNILANIAEKGHIRPPFPYSMIKSTAPDKTKSNLYAVYKGSAVLGEGSFGKVKMMQNQDVNDPVIDAVKVLLTEQKKEHTTATDLKLAFGEHFSRTSKKGEEKFHLLMKFVHGKELYKFVEEGDFEKLPPLRQLDVALLVLQAIKDLHAKGYLHVDIKATNMIYDPVANKLTLIDYGLSEEIDSKTGEVVTKSSGSSRYLAPEIYKKDSEGNRTYNEATEAFAAGRVLQELFGFGYKYKDWKTQTVKPLLVSPFSGYQEIKELTDGLTQEDPAQRTLFNEAIDKLNTFREQVKAQFPIKVGILSIQDYEKTKAIPTGVDQVLLIDEAKPNSNTRARDTAIRSELEKSGVSLKNDIVESSDQNQLLQYFAEQSKKENCIFQAVKLTIQPDNTFKQAPLRSPPPPRKGLISSSTTQMISSLQSSSAVISEKAPPIPKWPDELGKESHAANDPIMKDDNVPPPIPEWPQDLVEKEKSQAANDSVLDENKSVGLRKI